MDKMGYEKGLVRYTTENNLQGGQSRILRPRIYVYAAFLLLLASSLLYGIVTRVPLELDVIRDRNKLYSETFDGMIENVYTLKLVNKDRFDHRFELTVTGIDSLTMKADKDIIPVASGEVVTMAVRLKADPYLMPSRSVPIDFIMQSVDDDTLQTIEDAKFIGPFRK
jgi:polyferredoxin